MGYRIQEKPDLPKTRQASTASTPASLVMHNGTIAHFAFPCWYIMAPKPPYDEMPPYHEIDHLGWPDPSHPDSSYQHEAFCHDGFTVLKDAYDLDLMRPIRLLREGFDGVRIVWANKERKAPEGLDLSVSIDDKDDWVVRLVAKAALPDAIEEPRMHRFAVLAHAPAKGRLRERLDIVAAPTVIVLPSGY